MKIQVITLFPEMFDGVFKTSMLWKAQKEGVVEYSCVNLRDFGVGSRKTVDDTPYGGGDGMVLMVEPLMRAVEAAKQQTVDNGQKIGEDPLVLLMTPRGDEQICVGNYVLTGGEIPAMTVIDSVVRLLPGVLGGETSAEIESFYDDDKTIEAPQYTRPADYNGMQVPEVLLSGNHAEIEKWRLKNNILT